MTDNRLRTATARQMDYIEKRNCAFDETGLDIEDFGMYCSAYADGHKIAAARLEAVEKERDEYKELLEAVEYVVFWDYIIALGHTNDRWYFEDQYDHPGYASALEAYRALKEKGNATQRKVEEI